MPPFQLLLYHAVRLRCRRTILLLWCAQILAAAIVEGPDREKHCWRRLHPPLQDVVPGCGVHPGECVHSGRDKRRKIRDKTQPGLQRGVHLFESSTVARYFTTAADALECRDPDGAKRNTQDLDVNFHFSSSRNALRVLDVPELSLASVYPHPGIAFLFHTLSPVAMPSVWPLVASVL